MLFARLGWRNVLIINPRDLKALVSEMKQYPCDFLSGVNTLFNAMLHAPGFDQVDFSKLHITLGGGMAVQATVAERWKECDRLHADAGVGSHRDFAGGVHQSA